MSGKRSLPSIWASRGALYAAVAAGGLALVVALGAWLVLTPSGDDASTAGRGPATGSTAAPSSRSEGADDEVAQGADPASQQPQGGVGAVPPSAVEGSAAATSPVPGAPGSLARSASGPRSATAGVSTTPRSGPAGSAPGSGQNTGIPATPGAPGQTGSPGSPTPSTSTPTPSTPPPPAPSVPRGPGRECPTPGKKDSDAGGAPVLDPGVRPPAATRPCGPPAVPPGQAHRPS